jgi:hypothetical protein
MRPHTFPGIFLGSTGNHQGTHKVFDINMGVVEKPHTITPLLLPDRVIKVVKEWGRPHQKEDKAKSLEFLNQKRQQYDWNNNDLEDAEGLVKSDISHPNIHAKFTGIDLESEQPHHHHIVKIIDNSKDQHVYATQHNASLDDLPYKTGRVSTAFDKADAFKYPDANPDPFQELDTPPTLLVPPVLMMDDNGKNPINDKEAATIEAVVLGSTTVDGLHCSTQVPLPPWIMK